MDKSEDFIGSDCTAKRDLKREMLGKSNLKSVDDKIDILDKTVEDTNCNITLLKLQQNSSLDDKQTSASSEKEKPTSLHVGPNGLVGLNGIEIEKSATFTHLFEHTTDSKNRENACIPSSSQSTHKQFCGTHSMNTKFPDRKTNERTDVNRPSASINCENSIAPENGSLLVGVGPSLEASKELHTDVSDKQAEVKYVSYISELQMPDIMRLIQKDLSEPYSIYTYRYFIHNWPKLCFLAMDGPTCVGAIVCKLDTHRKVVKRGYIAMLAVDEKYRKRKIGSNLVLKAIRAMVADDADEVVLETEITNRPALQLYENLGFVRDKRLFRYYLNGVDALRLKLWLR